VLGGAVDVLVKVDNPMFRTPLGGLGIEWTFGATCSRGQEKWSCGEKEPRQASMRWIHVSACNSGDLFRPVLVLDSR